MPKQKLSALSVLGKIFVTGEDGQRIGQWGGTECFLSLEKGKGPCLVVRSSKHKRTQGTFFRIALMQKLVAHNADRGLLTLVVPHEARTCTIYIKTEDDLEALKAMAAQLQNVERWREIEKSVTRPRAVMRPPEAEGEGTGEGNYQQLEGEDPSLYPQYQHQPPEQREHQQEVSRRSAGRPLVDEEEDEFSRLVETLAADGDEDDRDNVAAAENPYDALERAMGGVDEHKLAEETQRDVQLTATSTTTTSQKKSIGTQKKKEGKSSVIESADGGVKKEEERTQRKRGKKALKKAKKEEKKRLKKEKKRLLRAQPVASANRASSVASSSKSTRSGDSVISSGSEAEQTSGAAAGALLMMQEASPLSASAPAPQQPQLQVEEEDKGVPVDPLTGEAVALFPTDLDLEDYARRGIQIIAEDELFPEKPADYDEKAAELAANAPLAYPYFPYQEEEMLRKQQLQVQGESVPVEERRGKGEGTGTDIAAAPAGGVAAMSSTPGTQQETPLFSNTQDEINSLINDLFASQADRISYTPMDALPVPFSEAPVNQHPSVSAAASAGFKEHVLSSGPQDPTSTADESASSGRKRPRLFLDEDD